jgi:hypothetical protein
MSLRQPLLREGGTEMNLLMLQNAELVATQTELNLQDQALVLMSDTEVAYWDLAYAHEVKKPPTLT